MNRLKVEVKPKNLEEDPYRVHQARSLRIYAILLVSCALSLFAAGKAEFNSNHAKRQTAELASVIKQVARDEKIICATQARGIKASKALSKGNVALGYIVNDFVLTQSPTRETTKEKGFLTSLETYQTQLKIDEHLQAKQPKTPNYCIS